MTKYPKNRTLRMADGGDATGRWAQHVAQKKSGLVVGPGTGVSDSVPARYSKGEYVLPADTTEAIGVETLDAIKDATHTPAAVQRGLRNGGSSEQTEFSGGNTRRMEAGDSGFDGVGDQSGLRGSPRVYPLEQVKGSALHLADGGIPGIDVLERPFTSADSRAFAAQPGPGNPNVGPNGSAQAQSFRAPAAPAPVATPQTPRPTLRAGVAGQSGVASKAAYAGGRALSGVAKLAGALGPAAAGAGVVSNFNDYKINDPDVDSSASGTFRAFMQDKEDGVQGSPEGLSLTTFPKTRASLGKGLLEAGMDLGSFAANTLDYVVPGKAPVSTAYNKMLRNQFGDQLAPNAAVTAQVNSAAGLPTASPAPSAGAAAGYNTPGADANMPGQDPGRVALRGQGGTSVDGAPGVSKFSQNGKTLYSNVPGADNDKLMSNGPGVSTVPGMSREAIDAALGGQSAGTVSADNAIRAANLRDGVDMERGTSGEVAGRGARETLRLASSPLGTPGRAFAQKQLIADQEQSTLRRGQDITAGVSLSNQQSTARTAAATARADQMNKDRTYQFEVAKFGEDQAKNNFDQRQKAEKDLRDEIGSMLPPGVDGKPDMEAASRYAVGLNASMASFQESLSKKAAAGDSKAAATLADIRKRGPAALDATDKRAFINSMKVKDLAEKYSTGSLNPFGGRAVATDAPRTGLRKGSEGFLGFGGEYTTDQGDVIPARAIERENGEIFGGKRRVDLRNQ